MGCTLPEPCGSLVHWVKWSACVSNKFASLCVWDHPGTSPPHDRLMWHLEQEWAWVAKAVGVRATLEHSEL